MLTKIYIKIRGYSVLPPFKNIFSSINKGKRIKIKGQKRKNIIDIVSTVISRPVLLNLGWVKKVENS